MASRWSLIICESEETCVGGTTLNLRHLIYPAAEHSNSTAYNRNNDSVSHCIPAQVAVFQSRIDFLTLLDYFIPHCCLWCRDYTIVEMLDRRGRKLLCVRTFMELFAFSRESPTTLRGDRAAEWKSILINPIFISAARRPNFRFPRIARNSQSVTSMFFFCAFDESINIIYVCDDVLFAPLWPQGRHTWWRLLPQSHFLARPVGVECDCFNGYVCIY
jgi:hypothetical protein